MIYSMTGYGAGKSTVCDDELLFEIRSVNGRHFDCRINLPREFMALEVDIRKRVKSVIARGSLNVYLAINSPNHQEEIEINEKDVISKVKQLKTLARKAGLAETGDLDTLMRIIGSSDSPRKSFDLKAIKVDLFTALDMAIEGLLEQRLKEGKALVRDMKKRIKIIVREISKISKEAPKVAESYQTRIMKRLDKMAADTKTEYDSAKVITEIGFFAEKTDITEEIIRIDSHIEQINTTLEKGGVIGKKLDFLLQEFYREINTAGNKGNSPVISKHVVVIKEELEKMREQVQNIE